MSFFSLRNVWFKECYNWQRICLRSNLLEFAHSPEIEIICTAKILKDLTDKTMKIMFYNRFLSKHSHETKIFVYRIIDKIHIKLPPCLLTSFLFKLWFQCFFGYFSLRKRCSYFGYCSFRTTKFYFENCFEKLRAICV